VRSARWSIAIAVVLGLAASWRVLLEPGVVGLVHDWSIFPFASQNVALFAQLSGGWLRTGLGEPVVYPTEYPWRLGLAAISLLGVGGGVVSKAMVFGIPATAFLCATYLARRLGYRPAAAWLCGAFYALDPVMLNKLVSGQAGYLIGYATLPLALGFLVARGDDRRSAVVGVALGGALALAAIELQIGILAVVLLAAFALCAPGGARGRRLAVVAVAAVVLLAIELPTVVGLWHGTSGIEASQEVPHRLPWLAANTVEPLDAVRLTGYLTHYDVQSLLGWAPLWNWVSWLVVAFAIFGLFVAPPVVRRSALCLLPVFALVCGAKIPFLVPAVTALFEQVTPMQVFRELYHLMIVPSLFYALGIAAAAGFLYDALPRVRYVLAALVVACVGVYVEPMLTGDVTGWLAAAPYDDYLRPAYLATERGAGRVAWFPMDQPLGFDDRGAGVDPMSLTPPGSLWQYSLRWPLTAVDMEAHEGDTEALRDGLRALGVTTAVQRDRFFSRFRDYAPEHPPGSSLWSRRVELAPALGERVDAGDGIAAFRIAGAAPMEFAAGGFAVVPARFRVVAHVAAQRVPAFAFGQRLPAGVPYDAYYDVADRPYEALQLSDDPSFPPPWRVDAKGAFAGGDLWWWYRPPYAQTKGMALAIGRALMDVPATAAYRDAVAVVAWIATPAGGRLSVRCGRATEVIDTGGAWGDWRSQEIACGPMPAGGSLTLGALDRDAEVAIRSARLIERARYDAATAAYRGLIAGARHAVGIGPSVTTRTSPQRSGTGPALGTIARDEPAMLVFPAAAGERVRVLGPAGDLVAWRRSERAGPLRVALVGTGEPLHLDVPDVSSARWQLVRLSRAPLPAAAQPFRSAAALVVYGQAFDGGWGADGARSHLPTALGTNAFAYDRAPAALPAVRYAYGSAFRLAFGFGTAVLVCALALLVLLLTGAGVRQRREAVTRAWTNRPTIR